MITVVQIENKDSKRYCSS